MGHRVINNISVLTQQDWDNSNVGANTRTEKVLSEYLIDRDPTAPGEGFLFFFGRVRVRKVRVEILVQNFRGLLAEISPSSPE